jgi:energy-coupling factor transport system ATP-binding protein
VIQIERLTYTYPEADSPALKDVSLTVAPGEFLLMTGPSGGGKSTLLHAVNGLVPHLFGGAFAGRVRVHGLDTRRATPAQLAAHVGSVFQEPTSRFVATTVADEIAFGLELLGTPGREIRAAVEDTIERLDLGGLLDRDLDTLSGGEQQRVAVAAALARHPGILLLDEPTSQLDRQAAEDVIDWIVDLRTRLGVTAVISEHRLARLLPHVTRMAHISAGRVERVGAPEDVLGDLPGGPPAAQAARHLGVRQGDLPGLRAALLACAPAPSLPLPSMADARLEVQGLSFSFPQVRALTDISFEVHAGEVLGIVGRNGSGKSTLLRCLMGLLRPSAGDLRLDGVPGLDRSVAERARRMAYLPQWPEAMLFAENVIEELRLTLRNHGLADPGDHRARELLVRLGLEAAADRYPRDLSAGERQRAALAAVAVCRPGILLLDEPTLGMDPPGQDHLARLLREWTGEGMAVLLASHDVEFVASVADRVLILDGGRVLDLGPAAETLHRHPTYRTELQQVTGEARPASLQEVLAVRRAGGPHADAG